MSCNLRIFANARDAPIDLLHLFAIECEFVQIGLRLAQLLTQLGALRRAGSDDREAKRETEIRSREEGPMIQCVRDTK